MHTRSYVICGRHSALTIQYPVSFPLFLRNTPIWYQLELSYNKLNSRLLQSEEY